MREVNCVMVSVSEIVMVSIGFVLVAVLTPIGMNEITGANMTGWNAAVKTMFTVLLPIIYIVGVAVHYIPHKVGE